MTSEEGFSETVLAAMSDSRPAFDKLADLMNDKNGPFSKESEQAWIMIVRHHGNPFAFIYPVQWNKNVDPSKLSFAQLRHAYEMAADPLKPGIIEYLWSRKDIPKIDRLDYMMQIIRSDRSLIAVEYAARSFMLGTNFHKFAPLQTQALFEWWVKHRKEFVGK